MIDRQLPIEPTEHINPRTQVTLMPGCDAVCECVQDNCLWPWCLMPPTETEETE